MTELEALTNATHGTGLTVHEKYSPDKRRRTKLYYVTRNETCISPVIDYDQMNHFILGYRKALQLITGQPA